MNTKITEAEGVVATVTGNAVPAEEDILEEHSEMDSSDDEELNFVSVVSLKKDKKTLAAEEELRSDAMIKDWLETDQVSNQFIFDKAERSPETIGAEISIERIISSLDTMKNFRTKGHEDYPAVTMLARIHVAWWDNSGFQERVFSTASLVMSKSQTRVDFNKEDSHLERRTLLAHNKTLIRKGII